MSKVNRNGSFIRPEWQHNIKPGFTQANWMILEMLESVCNAIEALVIDLRATRTCPMVHEALRALPKIERNTRRKRKPAKKLL